MKLIGFFTMTKLVGILNCTNNSFSDGNLYNRLDSALQHHDALIKQGADIVDLGAQATSYDASIMPVDEEWRRLEPLLRLVASPNISVDTFNLVNAQRAVDMGVGYINDVSGGKDPKMLKLIADNPHVQYICMFSLVLPADKEIRIKRYNEVMEWAQRQVQNCLEAGIKRQQLIIDPGIGFSTGADNSFLVIKNIAEFKKLGVQVMIGHSRKSFFNMLASHSLSPKERDIETLAASLYMHQKGVDYLRVHNVDMHKRAFNVFAHLNKK